MSQLLIVLPSEKFRDIEYIVPKEFFKQKKYKVMTTSAQKKSIGRFGYTVKIDYLLEGIDPANFDGIFFVGGLGSLDFIENETAKKLTQTFLDQNKVVGAICAAPRILLHWGLLKGERCTGNNWDNEFPSICREQSAIWRNEEVVISGNFITAQGPETAEAFAIQSYIFLSFWCRYTFF